jgi:hypothetical protein
LTDRGFGLLAALNFVAFLLPVFMIYREASIREKQGVPKEHQDLWDGILLPSPYCYLERVRKRKIFAKL